MIFLFISCSSYIKHVNSDKLKELSISIDVAYIILVFYNFMDRFLEKYYYLGLPVFYMEEKVF